ncbi:putative ABC transporter permease subunit [Dethiobacter alkaliphilus]|uniref:ABC-2 type transport system permease protein n=1 Tax=Dethiobacter alkaliphilus AHT 1 TaxID=555088 RepID=C0GFQ5_DETAL|nr:hypothetical protein [Dethiobacter alkaliphilus]EEG78015.1 conserved hypothetical protein [Dethiobacter alkaliphilus AHT 1]
MRMLQLIWLQIRVNFSLSAINWYRKKDIKKFLGSLGLFALIVISLGPIFYLYLRLVQETYKAGLTFGQAEVVLTSALVLASVLVLMFGFVFVMSVFYYSKDLSILVPLPYLPKDILGAKFSVVLIYDYLTILPFYLPALWVYGSNTGAGPLYWIIGAVVFFLVPVIPLTLASIFVLFLMRVTNFSRRRDTLRMIGLVLFIFILLGFNYFITGIPVGEEAEFIEMLFLEEQGLVSYVSRIYPPALFATKALTSGGVEGILNFAYFLGFSFAGIASMLLIGQKIFYQGLIGGEEVQSRKAISQEKLEKKISQPTSFVWAIAMREIKYLFRTPIYLFNSVAMLAIVPLLFVIPALSGGSMDQLITVLQEMEPRVAQLLGGAVFIAVLALFVPAASSSFSREGKLFWVSQVIPIPPKKQIQGKILYSFILASLTLPIVVLMSLIMLPWSLTELLIVLGGGMVLSFPAITLSLLIDFMRPYLTWDSPQKAIKQNINVVLAMVAGGGLYYLLYLAGRTAYFATEAELPVYLVVLGGATLFGILFYWIMIKIAPGKYNDINIK